MKRRLFIRASKLTQNTKVIPPYEHDSKMLYGNKYSKLGMEGKGQKGVNQHSSINMHTNVLNIPGIELHNKLMLN